jgi:hypothetical protein
MEPSWYGPALVVTMLALSLSTLFARLPLLAARALVVIGFVIGLAGGAFYLIASYAPIHMLAGAIE